jgi:hypothetical protein
MDTHMENKTSRAGRMHFFNPRNYLRNLSDYHSPETQAVNIDQRRYKTVKKFNPRAIFALSFGVDGYNSVLAKALKDARQYFGNNAPLLAQWDVKERYSLLFDEEIYPVEARNAVYTTTRGVFKSAREKYFVDRPDALDSIVFVAHPAHMERVLVTASQEGLEGVPFTPASVLWNRASNTQRWTNSKVHWVSRELWIARTVGSFL